MYNSSRLEALRAHYVQLFANEMGYATIRTDATLAATNFEPKDDGQV